MAFAWENEEWGVAEFVINSNGGHLPAVQVTGVWFTKSRISLLATVSSPCITDVLFCALKNKFSEERGVLCFPFQKVRIVFLLPALFKTMLFYLDDARRTYKHN